MINGQMKPFVRGREIPNIFYVPGILLFNPIWFVMKS